jgi:hypothetical protein
MVLSSCPLSFPQGKRASPAGSGNTGGKQKTHFSTGCFSEGGREATLSIAASPEEIACSLVYFSSL